ncbi:hypothetical protein Taro_038904 [Colocasia esculenta]|uniref:Uncharacterized protein n=1 Tax=Colocasia esculenta TaxID=4460 RepID=A0A843W9A2_COLES|nr:hypothetical protein [Colocasia esculenta]
MWSLLCNAKDDDFTFLSLTTKVALSTRVANGGGGERGSGRVNIGWVLEAAELCILAAQAMTLAKMGRDLLSHCLASSLRTMSLARSHASSAQNFFGIILNFLETFLGSMGAGVGVGFVSALISFI